MSNAAFTLPEVVDLTGVTPLRDALLALRGSPLDLDGSQVQRLCGLGLQVLMSAAKAWQADGQAFEIVNPSAALSESLRLTSANIQGSRS